MQQTMETSLIETQLILATLRLWGVSQQEYAQKCGYTYSIMNRFLHGKEPLHYRARQRLAEGLKLCAPLKLNAA